MTISMENRHTLERKLGRAVPSGDPKISLSLSALSAIMDAARDEERKPEHKPSRVNDPVQDIMDILNRGKR